MTSKRPGRPLTKGVTEALLQAAERLMTESGFSALTVDRLTTEIGTTRPAFYRRFPSVAHLALEVVRNRFGTGDPVNTDSLANDLLTLQRNEVAMFANPLLRNSFFGFLEAARTDAHLLDAYQQEFVGPRRANVRRVLTAAEERGEISLVGVDVGYIMDLLVGPILARAFLPSGALLDDTLARETVEDVLRRLGSNGATA